MKKIISVLAVVFCSHGAVAENVADQLIVAVVEKNVPELLKSDSHSDSPWPLYQ